MALAVVVVGVVGVVVVVVVVVGGRRGSRSSLSSRRSPDKNAQVAFTVVVRRGLQCKGGLITNSAGDPGAEKRPEQHL